MTIRDNAQDVRSLKATTNYPGLSSLTGQIAGFLRHPFFPGGSQLTAFQLALDPVLAISQLGLVNAPSIKAGGKS